DGGVGGQRRLEMLAHRGDRDGAERVNALRACSGFVDGSAGPGQQFRLVEPAGVSRDDVGDWDLAGVPVGTANRHGVADGGVAPQRLLDYPGIDVVAAADDEVLGPARKADEAVRVDAAEVPGVQPAVADHALLTEPEAAVAGAGDVAGEHGGPADRQHAGLAGGAVRPGPVIADPDGFHLL